MEALRKATETLTTDPEWGELGLVVVIFVVAAFFFRQVFRFSGRLDHTSYLSTVITTAMSDAEMRQILRQLDEDFDRGRYHEKVLLDDNWLSLASNRRPKPDPVVAEEPEVQRDEDAMQSWRGISPGPGYDDPWRTSGPPRLGYTRLPGAIDEGRSSPTPEQERTRQLIEQYKRDVQNWRIKVDREARRRYGQEVDEKRLSAEVKARSVLGQIDLGVLRGRGPQFLLQFTAIVVIILSTVALGILGKLSPEQSGTILAAVAGYVLGKSADSGAPASNQMPTPSNPEGASMSEKPDPKNGNV